MNSNKDFDINEKDTSNNLNSVNFNVTTGYRAIYLDS